MRRQRGWWSWRLLRGEVGMGQEGADAAALAGPRSATSIRPPCSSTTQRAIARPRPVPPSAAPAGGEALEDPGAVLGRDARALVGDLEDHATRSTRYGTHRDGPAGRAVPRGVVEQVGDHLVQPGPVARATTEVRVASTSQRRRRPTRPASPASWRTVSSRNGPTASRARRRAARCPASTRDRSSRSVTSRPSRSVWASAAARRRGVAAGDAVDEVLQHRPQRGDRRAQLVRDVGDQLAALPVDRVEVGRHLVERAGRARRPRRGEVAVTRRV